ncbi:C-type lectin 9a-like isoform X2 [Portunus trituberculatus]|nr:C-type lectin 9a-like isoform X2 [Portunus trituberculatus]
MARFCYPVGVVRSVAISIVFILSVVVVVVPKEEFPYQFFKYTRCTDPCRYPGGFILDQCCYVPVYKALTWDDARKYCKNIGGPLADLACPPGGYALRYELDRIKKPIDYKMWIGVSTQQAKTIFVTGMQISCLAHWYAPKEGECTFVYNAYSGSTYWSGNCSTKLPFVCEMPLV